MPRVIVISSARPMSADTEWAARVFGSPLRLHLIAHFREHPGPQSAAMEALGVARNSVSENTQVLVEAGVVTRESSPDKRTFTHRVNDARVRQLLDALRDFALTDTDQANTD